jgi:hypothetical protein
VVQGILNKRGNAYGILHRKGRSRLQAGKESSFAQAASPTTLVDLTSESIKVAVEKGDEGSLLGSKTASIVIFWR